MKSVVGPHSGRGLDNTELGHTCMMCCTTYIPADMVSHCVLGSAPSYLCDLFRTVSDIAACWVLCSAMRDELLVPQAHMAIMQCRAFWLWVCPFGMTSHLSCVLCQQSYLCQRSTCL